MAVIGLLLLAFLGFAPIVQAATVNATSCSQAHIDSAIDAATDGDTVAVPSGTCTWTGTQSITKTLSKSITIQGAGAIYATDGGASTTGSDTTVIIDNHGTTGHKLWNLTISAGYTLRITGIAFKQDGSSTTTQAGVIAITGSSSTVNSIRIDHCHFVTNADSSVTLGLYGSTMGVFDHNYFDSALGTGPFAWYGWPAATWGGDSAGFGDVVWTEADNWGTSKFIYFEDNKFVNGMLGDADGATRIVYRYNTYSMDDVGYGNTGYFANHGLSPGRKRGTRAVEFYNNTITAPGPTGFGGRSLTVNSGPALVWGNTITQYRYAFGIGYTREDNATYDYGSPPTGWGNCTGSAGTVWDNASGYPCMDGPGRGVGDLVTGGTTIATAVNNRTGTQAEVLQSSSPVYIWGNTFTPSSGYSPTGLLALDVTANLAAENRDYYQSVGASCTAGGSCTTGVGSGTSLPTSCTANAYGTGVGFWKTDEGGDWDTTHGGANDGKLYVCTATNTWTAWYTPYTYPHPLQGAVTQPTTGTQRGVSIGGSVLR